MNQKIYRNWDTKKTVDANNAVSGVLLNIAYPQKPTWDIYYRDNNKALIDLSGYIFRAAMDTDFNDETDVMSRSTYDMVDVSQAAIGLIKVTNNSDNARFRSQVNAIKGGARQVTFQIYGCRPGEAEDFTDTIMVNALMPVDPYGATLPPPTGGVTWASQLWVESRLRDGREIQFSLDGATGWHETQADTDRYWQERYPEGEWSETIAMVQGQRGVTGAGETGATGPVLYSWVMFADSVTGEGMTSNPDGKYYLGIATNQESPVCGVTADMYSWIRTKGEPGQDGSLMQLNADWGATQGVGQILNKPETFPAAAHGHTFGEIADKPDTYPPSVHGHTFTDLAGIPETFPPASHNHALNDLSEKSYNSLTDKPTSFPPASHNHALNDLSEKSYNSLTDKPTIPAAQVNSDWGATMGVEAILNKPSTYPPSVHGHTFSDLAGIPETFPPSSHGHTFGEIADKPDTYPPSGHTHSYDNLTDKPEIPAAQIQSDWNQGNTAAADYIKNKPTSLGTNIETLLFRVPTMADDSALHFALEVFSTADYSGTAVESANSAVAQTYLKISTGSDWLAFPADGVGTPFYGSKLAIELQAVENNIQYYLRYKWFVKDSDPAETPWYLSQYPALEYEHLTADEAGTDIRTMLFRVPEMADDSALQFALEVFDNPGYTGAAVESIDTAAETGDVSVFDGTDWVDFPADGVGTPYYANRLSATLQQVDNSTQYYIRYKFFISETDPAETPWFYTQYPALEVMSGGGAASSAQSTEELVILEDAANISWDLSAGKIAKLTLGGNRQLDDPDNPTPGIYALKIVQPVSGNCSLAFDGAYKWAGGTGPSLSTSGGAVDIATFVCDGFNMYGNLIQGMLSNTTHTLTYTAGANGTISGASPQTVVYGEDGAAVTAVPGSEYSFVNWSDGSTENPRTDTNIKDDISVTANFSLPNNHASYFNVSSEAGGSLVSYSGPGGALIIPSVISGVSITNIQPTCFQGRNTLTSVVIPNGIIYIFNHCFAFCENLSSVTFPSTLSTIREFAFYECFALSNVTFPANLSYLGEYSFRGCSNLQTAHFDGNAPTTVGDDVFAQCHANFHITYHSGATGFTNPWHGYPCTPV